MPSSSLSHTGMERGINKVRKARTIVMILLVAVAIAIVLIDRSEEDPNIDLQNDVLAAIESSNTSETSDVFEVTTNNTNNPVVPQTPSNMANNIAKLQPEQIVSPVTEAPRAQTGTINNPNVEQMQIAAMQQSAPKYRSLVKPQHKTVRPKVRSKKKIAKRQQLASGRRHIVKSGETLGSIARNYYGSASKWRKIKTANPRINPRRLKLGMKLVIPQANNTWVASKTSTRRLSPNSRKRNNSIRKNIFIPNTYHTVRRGETLTKIAQSSGIPFLKIYDKNKNILKNGPHRLKPGMRIFIPAASSR